MYLQIPLHVSKLVVLLWAWKSYGIDPLGSTQWCEFTNKGIVITPSKIALSVCVCVIAHFRYGWGNNHIRTYRGFQFFTSSTMRSPNCSAPTFFPKNLTKSILGSIRYLHITTSPISIQKHGNLHFHIELSNCTLISLHKHPRRLNLPF